VIELEEKVRIHQKTLTVSQIVAGIAGICFYDEVNDLYYPLPKEFVALAEEHLPGTKEDKDVSVTVLAGATTGSNKVSAESGTVFYVEKIIVSGSPPSGKYTIRIGGVDVFKDRALAAETVDLVSELGKRVRGDSVEILVTLDSAPTSDTTIDIKATVITRKALV